MKFLIVAIGLLVAGPAFSGVLPGYVCVAPDLTVTISGDSSLITVKMNTSTKTYKVVGVTSMTGDTDQTFQTAEGLSVTIDDQYGDALTEATGKVTPLKCHN